ncbi:MAG TPA: hypothetical protein VGO87_07045 [Acidimicrobiia bacterium]|jgi:hypothetical protein
MGVEKMSVSFDLELGEAIRSSAASGNQSVSAWLAEAARDRLRHEALGEAIGAWEQAHGPLTDAEVAEAERLLTARRPSGTKSPGRRRGAA